MGRPLHLKGERCINTPKALVFLSFFSNRSNLEITEGGNRIRAQLEKAHWSLSANTASVAASVPAKNKIGFLWKFQKFSIAKTY